MQGEAQVLLAEQVGVSRQSLSSLEAGRSVPSTVLACGDGSVCADTEAFDDGFTPLAG